MSATLSKLRISWVGRALLAYAVSALALVVLSLAAPGSAVFFPLVSLWCNLALFGLVLVVLRLADVKFDLFHWAVIIGFWAAALLYFYWAETRRSFVYIWDYVNYINKQYNAEAAFLQGPAVGFHFILDSLAEDYTNFNTLFIEFPFCLTDRTGDSFAICQVFSIVPMLLLLLAGLVVKVGQMLQVKNRFWYFLIGLSWTFTYPWLRMSAVLSQPDWFGLIFAFSILLLTLDFRFEKLDLPRFGLLFLATAAIILSRRWYLYFVVGYYFAYAVLVLVSSASIAKVGRKQDALLQVLLPSKGVDEPLGIVVGHGIDGKVPPGQVLPHIRHKVYLVRVAAVGIGPLGAEGRCLIEPAALLHRHGAVLQAGGDTLFLPEQRHHLLRAGAGAEVPIVGGQPQQAVPDTAAHSVGRMARPMERIQQQGCARVKFDRCHVASSSYCRMICLPSKPHSAAGNTACALGRTASGSRIMGE